MTNFKSILHSLGNLHDAKISMININIEEASFSIEIKDIYSSFKGLPEYKGAKKGSIVIRKISRFHLALDLRANQFNIYDLSVTNECDTGATLIIKFWPAGIVILDYGEADYSSLAQ